MKKIFICLAAALCSVAMQAQNLDPTVEVSRVYEGKLIEVRKPVMDMAVPDTLYRFDLDFDYSVFDNPYRGAYEFNPYILDMRPESDLQSPSRLFLRAGAGYTLHPVFDVLWSPRIKGPFSVDVYGTHRSYVGEYRSVAGNPAYNGYDLLSKAGADFGYDWNKAGLDFGASYYGVALKDFLKSRSYNAVDAYASLKSKSKWPKHFMYGVDLKYRFAGDSSTLSEHDFSLDATFGPSFDSSNKVFFDLGVDMNAYSGAMDAVMSRFYLAPHYIYDKGILRLDLGFRLSAALTSGKFERNQIIYPDLRMDLAVIPDAMRFYVTLGGGERLNSFASLIDDNHHVDLSYGMGLPSDLLCPSIERLSAQMGFEGRISGFFSYNLRGGYVNNAYAPLDAVRCDSGVCRPFIGYTPYQKAYAALDWDLDLRSVKFDGSVEYTHSWGFGQTAVLVPAMLTADAEVLYKWRKRLYAGVDCIFSTSRMSVDGRYNLPWYADLGVYAEYAVNKKLSVWLRGGNLMNMEIQKSPLFAEKGINFTAGISLTF